MKKILSVFSVLLLAGSLCAADVTVTESLQTCPYTGAQSTRVSYNGDNYVMYMRGARSKSTDVLKDGTKAIWMSRGSSSSCYVETENLAIGGIKAVSFNWRQFGTESSKLTLKLQIKINGTEKDLISKASGQTYIDNDQSYSKSDFNFKANAKLTIANVSDSASKTPKTNARILLGPITITPYLYYGTRVATIGLQQQGYKNTSLINNTGTTPTFSSSEESVATVEADGTIIPVAVGQTTITASWEQVTVTYVLNVVDNILVENFSLVNQSKLATTATSWTGDVCNWTVDSVRKAINDTTCNNPRIQGIYAPIYGYLSTTNTFEGGIKHLYFKWQQWGSEADKTLKLNIKAGTYDNTVSVAGVAGGAQQEQTFDADLEVASAQQLTIKNVSVVTASGATPSKNARLVISDMRITPYLLYTVKEADAYMKDGAFTNEALINNTTGAAVEYSLVGEGADQLADINTTTGAVTVKQNGQVTVKATWGQVSTTYTLNLHAQSEPEMSFANNEIRTVLGGSVANALSKKTDATPTYASSNTAVAEVDASTGAITIKNVGQTKITATCAATESYKAGEASYELIVRAGGNTLKESFGQVDKDGNATGAAGLKVIDWNGDLFTWQAKGNARRKPNSDTIYNTTTQGTFIGVNPDSVGGTGILRSKEAVEGGIKYISFFWKQWATENDGRTLRLNIYAGEDSVTCVEHVALNPNPKNVYWYYAASNLMKANKQLIIKNVSRLANGELAPSNARVILDTIEITPYLLYTLKEDTLDFLQETTYTNTHLIDNRDNANAISYSILEGDASVDTDGKVTANAAGTVKVQAEWDGVTTTYTLIVKGANQYTLTWDADGGELTGGTPAGLVNVGAELTAPTATKTGYNHTGWDPEVPATMPDSDVTYTATYEAKKCNITLKSNYEGGEEDIEFVATYGEASPVGGETAKFTRPGYSINRGFWKNQSTEASGERLVNSNGKFTTNVGGYTDKSQKWIRDAEEDITLYAHWKLDTFKITYANMEGATNFEDAPAKYTVETPTITLGTPTKTGYTFAGWKAKDAEGAAVTEIALGSIGDTTLYATWTAKKCTITLKCNYTDGPADIVFEATYGEVSPISEVHARENYTMYRGYWMDPETEASGTRLVNPTGKFTTGVGGYTDANQKWVRDAEEDITLYAHWTLSTLEINEEADNAALLTQYDGKTMDVKLTRSALVENVWNSLCLPFAIAKTDLGEAQVVEMTGAEMEGDVINVTFAEFNSDTLVAGTPYLVKPSAAVALTAFEDKKISATPKTIGDNGLIELTGIYSPFAMTANDKSKLFLAQPDAKGNNLFFASENGNLKGMRAYFNIVNAGAQAAARVGRMVINQTNTPTGNENVNVNANVNENQKVIINGQLIIIRDGVMYNAMGQEL